MGTRCWGAVLLHWGLSFDVPKVVLGIKRSTCAARCVVGCTEGTHHPLPHNATPAAAMGLAWHGLPVFHASRAHAPRQLPVRGRHGRGPAAQAPQGGLQGGRAVHRGTVGVYGRGQGGQGVRHAAGWARCRKVQPAYLARVQRQ